MLEKIKAGILGIKKVFSRKIVVAAGAAILSIGSAVQSHAAAVLDFTSVGTSITAEITPALASAMPIAGTLLGVTVAYKMFRRFVK